MAILEPTKKANTLDMMRKINSQQKNLSLLEQMKEIKAELNNKEEN